MKAWTEQKEDIRIRIAFTGQDGDARDAAEIERFRSELSTPATSDTATPDGGLARYRGSSTMPQLGTVGVLCLMFGGFFLFVAAISSSLGLALFASPFLFWVFLKTLLTVRFPKKVSTEEPFSIVFEPGIVRVESSGRKAEYPLDRIAQFEGGSRLVIVQTDGTRETLKPVLGTRVDTTELAARLDEGLMEAKRWSGGYR